MQCLTWKHEYQIPGDGEIFRREDCSGCSGYEEFEVMSSRGLSVSLMTSWVYKQCDDQRT